MKAMIFGTTYLGSAPKAELFQMWSELLTLKNPEMPYVAIDATSPQEFIDQVSDMANVQRITIGEQGPLPPPMPGLNWFSHANNIGHLSKSGRDGWGRAFCTGLQIAIEHNYDYVAAIESDVLFRPAIKPIFEKMQRQDIKALSAWERRYNFLETGVMFFNVNYLREIDFIAKYDWANRKIVDKTFPEHWVHDIIKDEVLFKMWVGTRDDHAQTRLQEVPQLDYLTHAHDQKLYYAMMMLEAGKTWAPPRLRQAIAC